MKVCSKCLSKFRTAGTFVLINEAPEWLEKEAKCDLCKRMVNTYLSDVTEEGIQDAKKDHIKRSLK